MAQATITYQYDSNGQKAAIAAGTDGNRIQTVKIEVDPGDLQLFDVDSAGTLSADAKTGTKLSYGTTFESYWFDFVPTAQNLLAFLRERKTRREQVLAEEAAARATKAQAEAEQRAASIAAFITKIEAENAAGTLNISYYGSGGISNPSGPNPPADHQAVIEYIARWTMQKTQKDAVEAQKEQIEKAAIKPKHRPVTAEPASDYSYIVPCTSTDERWAKLLSGVDANAKGGYAWEGSWLDCGKTRVGALGDIIVCGGKTWTGSKKRGEWKHYTNIYVVTPAGVLLIPEATPVNVRRIFQMDTDARIKHALECRSGKADDALAALDALPIGEFGEEAQALFTERRAEWVLIKAACEQALSPNESQPVADPRAEAVAQIRALMAEHGITAEEVQA